jgi:hypothetical protein
MKRRNLINLVLIFSVLFLFSCSASENEATNVATSGDYEDLVSLFKEFREFHKPKMANGIPDYSAKAMEEKKSGSNTIKLSLVPLISAHGQYPSRSIIIWCGQR